MRTYKYFNDCQTLDDAKKKYKDLVKQLHPDLNPEKDTTKFFQEMQNEFEKFVPQKEKFEGEQNQWNAKEYSDIITQLLKIENIKIEICGSWIWLSGNTFAVKDQIKSIECGESMKRGFSRQKTMWYFSPKGYKKYTNKDYSIDQIRNKYGSDEVDKKSKGNLLSA